jgi:hypothetical protein
MAHLTVTEKEHWKNRISARIERTIESIEAKHPALFDRVKREAHALAIGSLGVSQTFAELEAIQAEEIALARRKEHVQRTMVATVRGVPLEGFVESLPVVYGRGISLPVEVGQAISKRQTAHQEQLLAEDPIGQEVAQLKQERDNVLDVIWLATSPAELRQLWIKVSALLGDVPTQLERDALSIQPSTSEAASTLES